MAAILTLRSLLPLPLLLLVTSAALQAPPVITGRVSDGATAAPLHGAQVLVRGTMHGALTDARGTYRITLPDTLIGREVQLAVAVMGYGQDTRTVRVAADSTVVDFSLNAQSLTLKDVVVTGADRIQGKKVPFSVTPELLFRTARPDHNTESYARIEENGFRAALNHPLSTFGVDVDRASYANVRRFLQRGKLPPADAVRIEELINYFPYGDPPPTDEHPFSVNTEVAAAPWQPAHQLLRIGLQGRQVATADLPPANLVFLIDVSGSMRTPNKLPLVKRALAMVVDELRPQDRVAIVVYAGATGLALPSTSGADKAAIRAAIDRLEAGGSTAGGAGLRLAYRVATEHHIPGGINRVVLATDGDFNVGASSDAQMIRLVEQAREGGTALTVLGFGMGNLKDSKLEGLADHGNGNYAYIDDLAEARKALVEERGGTFFTLAKDVKIQVEFNPAFVHAYRLIGYENRLLDAEDFEDDGKDAGDLGAGHAVTALYEIVPAGVEHTVKTGSTPPLRYQGERTADGVRFSDELAFVSLRYKPPEEDVSRLVQVPVAAASQPPSADLRFAAAVAGFGMILRDSEHRGRLDYASVLEQAAGALGEDPGGHRAAFLELVRTARRVSAVAAEAGSGG
ncbi:MAG: von Willebrand factor type A domain-containing protein [Gemmatimonadota bacterium]